MRILARGRRVAALDSLPPQLPLNSLARHSVIAIFAQCCAGLVKFVQRDGPAPPPAGGLLSYHGLFGPFVWLCGLLCIVLALYFEYLEVPPHDAQHWTLDQILVAGVLVATLAAAVLASICRPRAKTPSADSDDVVDVRGLLNGD